MASFERAATFPQLHLHHPYCKLKQSSFSLILTCLNQSWVPYFKCTVQKQSFSNDLQLFFFLKETLVQVFFNKFCEVFCIYFLENTFGRLLLTMKKNTLLLQDDRGVPKSPQISKMESFSKMVNCLKPCYKSFPRRCLKGFLLQLWITLTRKPISF